MTFEIAVPILWVTAAFLIIADLLLPDPHKDEADDPWPHSRPPDFENRYHMKEDD